jgi:hypothetical protein
MDESRRQQVNRLKQELAQLTPPLDEGQFHRPLEILDEIQGMGRGDRPRSAPSTCLGNLSPLTQGRLLTPLFSPAIQRGGRIGFRTGESPITTLGRDIWASCPPTSDRGRGSHAHRDGNLFCEPRQTSAFHEGALRRIDRHRR